MMSSLLAQRHSLLTRKFFYTAPVIQFVPVTGLIKRWELEQTFARETDPAGAETLSASVNSFLTLLFRAIFGMEIDKKNLRAC